MWKQLLYLIMYLQCSFSKLFGTTTYLLLEAENRNDTTQS